MLEKTLESPLDCKEIKQFNPKEINPEYSLEGLKLQLEAETQKLWPFDMKNQLKEKILMLGKIEGRRKRREVGGRG